MSETAEPPAGILPDSDAPPLAPADRAIVEAVIAAWMQMRHGPKLRTDEPMARASLAAALPLVAGICMHLGPNHCACNSREPDCARCIALKAAADEINALAARLAEAGNE